MACSNHPSEKDIEEIERTANRQAENVRQTTPGEASVQHFAEKCAKEVKEYARLQVQLSQQSGKQFSASEVAAIKGKIDQFAKAKAEEVRQYERLQSESRQAAQEKTEWMSTRYREAEPDYRQKKWVDPKPLFTSKAGRVRRDEVPDFNPNPDADTISGFHSGLYENPGGFGIVMKDENEPDMSTHIHYHKDGITLSTFNARTGAIDRFNLTTGESETIEGEGTEWPED